MALVDTLCVHTIRGIRTSVEGAGARRLYVSAYASDIDLIELDFATLRAIKRACPRFTPAGSCAPLVAAGALACAST